MIDTILITVKMIVAILPFIFLFFLSKKVNLPKVDRSKQFLMPVISFVYGIVAMLMSDLINTWLIKLIQKLPVWIEALAGVSWMPEMIGELLSKFARFLAGLISGLSLDFWIFFVANAAIILGYMIVKQISIDIMAKVIKPDNRIYVKVSEKFYEYFSDKNEWCLKESYVQARSLLKFFYFCAFILSSILMIASSNFYLHGLIKAVFYPVFGVIVIGEVYFYLDGLTKQEYSEDVLGEDEDAYKIVNYSLLRKFLRSVFGDKLLTENTSISTSLAYNVTNDEIIEELEKNDDPKIVSFASYIESLNKSGFNIDHNYIYSALDMLNGKSILFNNPFYNDLIPYAFYPMNRTLLNHQKVLVVLGRHAIENDIKEWLEKGIEAVTNIPFLWNIGVLNSEKQDLDIGIITRSDVLNMKLHNANSEFLENVGFFIIIEPSKLISTAQIGLNILVKKCNKNEDKNVVYCMCDKNCDGLVDAISHILMKSITEVSSTEKHRGTSSYMCWNTDSDYLHHRLFPNISRYLGVGTELSFAALKNQVSKTEWFGGEAFPVTDIHWIDKQYYYDLTKYACLPTSQEALDEYFVTTPNFWNAEIKKNNYLTVEDESFNMFEVLRDFSTRTEEQGFINVISSEYLLRDYMADNASIFETDSKAIPYIVADYTRSNRNTILRLILMMSTFPVNAEALENEFSLLGVDVFALKKQLWYEIYNCFADVSSIASFSGDYVQAVNKVYYENLKLGETEWTHNIIKVEEKFNLIIGKMEITYSITNPKFLALCVAELRSAGYVAEDEKGNRYYLGSELYGHIYQKYLPGQFFTFGGKYYEMQYLTADGQLLVRRAADHINGRPAYRQIRNYIIHGVRPSEQIGAQRDIAGLKVIKEFADISVRSPGYYLMQSYNDFTTAKKISFEGEKNGIPERLYRNKEIIRIELPDFDGKLNDNIRYTVTVLFNEIFRTFFAENQPYICALTDDSFVDNAEELLPLTYKISGDGYKIDKNAIYIIEDSQLDLGLTVAVERNIQRIFNIIFDYLDWHMEALELSLNPPEEPKPTVFTPPTDFSPEPKKKGIKAFFAAIGRGIKKFFGKIKNLFKRKPKDKAVPADEAVPDGGAVPAEVPKTETADVPKTEAEGAPESGTTATPDDETVNIPEDEISAETTAEISDNGESDSEENKKSGFFGWFKRKKDKNKKKKKKDEVAPEDEEATKVVVTGESDDEGNEVENTEMTEPETALQEPEISDNSCDEKAVTGEDLDEKIVTEETSEEPVETRNSPFFDENISSSEKGHDYPADFSTEKRPYHERYYTLFGSDVEPPFIDLAGTKEYLSHICTDANPLKQAREGKKIADYIEATFKPGRPDARYCDFCGTEIYGVEYETLADGRDRCINCSKTAIKTGEEFKKIFYDVKRNMESFFGIRINAGIKVEMVNSRILHKRLGKAFIPTPKSDGRVLGVAISDKTGYSLLVENGSPRMASMLTMAHELTHIWQYVNWDDKKIRKKYGKNMRLEVYEGMAKWVEIQYAYLINEPATAKREEIITSHRNDEYGYGFLKYRANYPFSLGTVITRATPFMNGETPLTLEMCGLPDSTLSPDPGSNPAGDLQTPTPRSTSPAPAPSPAPPVVHRKEPVLRKPGSYNRYAYAILNAEEKTVYDMVLESINNFEDSLEINFGITDEQVQKIVDFVQRDHPEIFWFQHGARFFFDSDTHIVSKIEFKYCMTQAEMQKRQKKIDASVPEFLESVNGSMSDFNTVLTVYENIIKLVDYDSIGLEYQTGLTVAPDVPDDMRSVYGVFVNKKAVCAGYAKAMQYLLNLCGIDCTYVTSETHAWNLINLGGNYYHLDATWGDNSNNKDDNELNDVINYDCFCITSKELECFDSHTPENSFPLPECTAVDCNYHRHEGLYFEAYDSAEIRTAVCESVKSGKFNISFKFSSNDVFNEAKSKLIDNGKFREIMQYAALKSNIKLDSTYKYSARENSLIIAFYMTKR